MKPFTFVHAADLHLDSPFIGIRSFNESLAEKLKKATFEAFENIIDLCIERQVDFLLVAGDVYDGAERNLRAQLAFQKGLKRLSDAGIASFVVHGNHDPLNGWFATLKWPEKTHIFGGNSIEVVPVYRNSKEIARIHGISFQSQEIRDNLAKNFRRSDSSSFAVGLLHCNVGTDTGHEPYAPCTLKDLIVSGLDYWALGHVHGRTILRDRDPMIIYPGNTQGRNPRETGERGCYIISVNNEGVPKAEFVATDTVRWFVEHVSIEKVEDDEQLIASIRKVCKKVRENADGRNAICRLILTGRGSIHKSIMRQGLMEDLLEELHETEGNDDPFVWVEKIEGKTRSDIDIDSRRQGEDFVADLLNLIQSYRENPDQLSSLTNELEPLFRSSQGQKLLDMPDLDRLKSYIDEVETLCLNYLVKDED